MDIPQEQWIKKLTGDTANPGAPFAASDRENEKKKWDAREKALTQIREKIAINSDRLKENMNVRVDDGKIYWDTLDYENRDQTQLLDWAEQYDGYVNMSDEDLEKHANASKLINTLVMELESATVEIGGIMVPLFDKKDIADEFYTPLVREGLMAETFVPNDYSRTQKMIEESFKGYKERLVAEGFSDMKNRGEMAQLGLSLAGSAASLTSIVPVVMDAKLFIQKWDPSSVELSNFVPAIEDSSWIADKGTSNFTEIADIISKGMDVLNDVVVEVGIDLYESEPFDKRRLLAGRIANSLVSGVSGVVSESMNLHDWNMGLAASTVYRSNANLKGITKLLQDKTSALEVADGDKIVGFLKAGFAKIFPPSVTKASSAVPVIESTFASSSASSSQSIADKINSEDYEGAMTLVTTAARAAMATATTTQDLIDEIKANKEVITQELGNEMAKELTASFEKTKSKTAFLDDSEKITANMDAKDRAPLIEKKIAELERARFQRKWIVTVMSQGTAFASKFFAPLVMAGSAVSLINNIIEADERLKDWKNFTDSNEQMLLDASPFSAPIANFVKNARNQATHYEVQCVCDALSLVGALLETISYATGPAAAIGVVVSQLAQASAGAASALESAMYEIQKKLDARAGWAKYKEALLKPENRKLALLAMKQNPTLAKYSIAWGAIIEKDPLVADFVKKTGLTAESLQDSNEGIGMVVTYLETRLPDDNVIVGREAVAKGWAPVPALTLECWRAAIRRGKAEANLVVVDKDKYAEKAIQAVEYSILACIKPWEEFEATTSTSSPKALVAANLSALQTLINELDYKPKQSVGKGGEEIDHAQMREFLGSMKKLAKDRIGKINNKYPIQTVKWADLVSIVYGTALGNSQKTADPDPIGRGTLKYSFENGDVLNAGDYRLAVYAEATELYQESPKVFAMIKVTKAEQVVDWVADLGEITTATPLGNAQRNAERSPETSVGGGELKYSFKNGDLLTAGTHQLSVYAEETKNYKKSPTVTRDITVVAAP
jgi:hypothetical protein